MRNGNRWIPATLLVVFGLVLALWFAFKDDNSPALAEATSNEAPAKVEPIEGSEFKRVILSQKAADRLQLQTAAVRDEQIGDTARKVVPSDAVIYGTKGETWIYTNPEPLVFVRQAVTVDRIEGELAVLSEGPPSDTAVAVVAVAELYGAETGWGGSGGH
jgi:hypothetical protein